VRIILLDINHEVQWKDPSGHLHDILADLMGKRSVDLVAEEATGMPTTVAQRLACKLDKPWIEIDLSKADRKLLGIDVALENRKTFPLTSDAGSRTEYLPKEDGMREEEWLRRILRQSPGVVLCLCGYMHLGPFTEKLATKGCDVERVELAQQPWFQRLYGNYNVVEEDGKRWFEVRHH
jgi:hypothetical protein